MSSPHLEALACRGCPNDHRHLAAQRLLLQQAILPGVVECKPCTPAQQLGVCPAGLLSLVCQVAEVLQGVLVGKGLWCVMFLFLLLGAGFGMAI